MTKEEALKRLEKQMKGAQINLKRASERNAPAQDIANLCEKISFFNFLKKAVLCYEETGENA